MRALLLILFLVSPSLLAAEDTARASLQVEVGRHGAESSASTTLHLDFTSSGVDYGFTLGVPWGAAGAGSSRWNLEIVKGDWTWLLGNLDTARAIAYFQASSVTLWNLGIQSREHPRLLGHSVTSAASAPLGTTMYLQDGLSYLEGCAARAEDGRTIGGLFWGMDALDLGPAKVSCVASLWRENFLPQEADTSMWWSGGPVLGDSADFWALLGLEVRSKVFGARVLYRRWDPLIFVASNDVVFVPWLTFEGWDLSAMVRINDANYRQPQGSSSLPSAFPKASEPGDFLDGALRLGLDLDQTTKLKTTLRVAFPRKPESMTNAMPDEGFVGDPGFSCGVDLETGADETASLKMSLGLESPSSLVDGAWLAGPPPMRLPPGILGSLALGFAASGELGFRVSAEARVEPDARIRGKVGAQEESPLALQSASLVAALAWTPADQRLECALGVAFNGAAYLRASLAAELHWDEATAFRLGFNLGEGLPLDGSKDLGSVCTLSFSASIHSSPTGGEN